LSSCVCVCACEGIVMRALCVVFDVYASILTCNVLFLSALDCVREYVCHHGRDAIRLDAVGEEELQRCFLVRYG